MTSSSVPSDATICLGARTARQDDALVRGPGSATCTATSSVTTRVANCSLAAAACSFFTASSIVARLAICRGVGGVERRRGRRVETEG